MPDPIITHNEPTGIVLSNPVFQSETFTVLAAITWPAGLLLARNGAGKIVPFIDGAIDGVGTPIGVLLEEEVYTGSGDRAGRMIVRGTLRFGDLVTMYGPNLVPEGEFDDVAGWTIPTGWTILNGAANADASQAGDADLTVATDLDVDLVYESEITVSAFVAGNVTPVVGDTEGTDRAADGVFLETIIAGATDDFDLRADVTFDGTVDHVRLNQLVVGTAVAITDIVADALRQTGIVSLPTQQLMNQDNS